MPCRWIATALLLAAFPAAALDLFVRSPRSGAPLFGLVQVEVEILSEAPVAVVEIHLNGTLVTQLTEPPWSTPVDVGEENRGHTFEIVVRDRTGAEARRTVETPPVETHDTLDLGLQQLYVTVTRGGTRVLDLERANFEVFDNGMRQQIVTFERGDVPLTAELLVDASPSMRGGRLDAALAGARSFVDGMRPLDEARLVLFSDRTLATTPFTGPPSDGAPSPIDTSLASAIEASGDGGTAISDHLYIALKELEPRHGRRVVILLSDGVDVESALGIDDVTWKAGRVPALVYWIRTPGAASQPNAQIFSAWRDAEGHRHEIDGLARLVQSSGGRILDLLDVAQAPAVFSEVLAELREQYVLGYYPTLQRGDGAWREVRVRVRGGARVRALGGYFDSAR